MTEHSIKKPTLFISHASSDGEFANAVKQEVEKVFANGVSGSASFLGTLPRRPTRRSTGRAKAARRLAIDSAR